MKNIIAIIPARGGSIRLPNKNLLPLNGKPLLGHTIEHAKKSRLVDRVIVSTDDNQIAQTSLKYGADVVKRPLNLASETATSESALLHVLDYLRNQDEGPIDLIVFLQCTSPLRKDDDIDQAIETLINKNADSLFSACRFDKYLWYLKNEELTPINYDYHQRWREQDFPLQYLENGSIYVLKPWVLTENENRLGGKIAVYEMDYWYSFQVDSIEDFRLCEFIMKGSICGTA